jgi:hypothetical protein
VSLVVIGEREITTTLLYQHTPAHRNLAKFGIRPAIYWPNAFLTAATGHAAELVDYRRPCSKTISTTYLQ